MVLESTSFRPLQSQEILSRDLFIKLIVFQTKTSPYRA